MVRVQDELASRWIDLAAKNLGAEVLFATDDFFAGKESLIEPQPAIFDPDRYTDRGKWMDGWESRRKRGPGHDYAIVRLGLYGKVRGLNIDTAHFTGNHPTAASVDACWAPGVLDPAVVAEADWHELMPKRPLGPGQQHLFEVDDDRHFSHVRLHIYPDGGVARLRVYGRGDRRNTAAAIDVVDLAAAAHGGLVTSCNDAYFSPKDNLIMPYRPQGMFDGWETRRRREPGNDWSIISLAAPGAIEKIDIDTSFFKGNYPDQASVDGVFSPEADPRPEADWRPLLPPQKLEADRLHEFRDQIDKAIGAVTHVRLNIFPDGGVARFRCFGKVSDGS